MTEPCCFLEGCSRPARFPVGDPSFCKRQHAVEYALWATLPYQWCEYHCEWHEPEESCSSSDVKEPSQERSLIPIKVLITGDDRDLALRDRSDYYWCRPCQSYHMIGFTCLRGSERQGKRSNQDESPHRNRTPRQKSPDPYCVQVAIPEKSEESKEEKIP